MITYEGWKKFTYLFMTDMFFELEKLDLRGFNSISNNAI